MGVYHRERERERERENTWKKEKNSNGEESIDLGGVAAHVADEDEVREEQAEGSKGEQEEREEDRLPWYSIERIILVPQILCRRRRR